MANKQELMWTCDKLQWPDKHIQALKLEKIVKNHDFHLFSYKIGLILHNFALSSGNYWLSRGLEQLVLSGYAISSISNLPKSIKSIKTSFSEIVESMEACNHCKVSKSQNFQKKVANFGFNHLFSRIGPF